MILIFELNVIYVAIVGFQVVYCCQQKAVQYTKVRKTNNFIILYSQFIFSGTPPFPSLQNIEMQFVSR